MPTNILDTNLTDSDLATLIAFLVDTGRVALKVGRHNAFAKLPFKVESYDGINCIGVRTLHLRPSAVQRLKVADLSALLRGLSLAEKKFRHCDCCSETVDWILKKYRTRASPDQFQDANKWVKSYRTFKSRATEGRLNINKSHRISRSQS